MTYEFICTKCQSRQESDNPSPNGQRCILCGEKLRRVFTAPGVIYKATGFYSSEVRK